MVKVRGTLEGQTDKKVMIRQKSHVCWVKLAEVERVEIGTNILYGRSTICITMREDLCRSLELEHELD